MGRKRLRPVLNAARRGEIPPWRIRLLKQAMKITESFTIIPARATTPRKETKLKGMPAMRWPNTAPTSPMGIRAMIRKACPAEPAAVIRIVNITISAATMEVTIEFSMRFTSSP